VHRHSLAVRHDAETAAPEARRPHPPIADLHDAGSIDLVSMHLVLQAHLDDLRRRGVDEYVLRPIEAELRRYDETVETLIKGQQQ